MFAKIRHVAIYTDSYPPMAKFYQTIFGMKRITTGATDETGAANPKRGHMSDGVIGMAILGRPPGIQPGGVDHFGFEVEDLQTALGRLKEFYPEIQVAQALDFVPFAGCRAHDPAGAQFDLSQKGMNNVREGYTEEGWDQPRWMNHIAIRASRPERLAEFYTKIFELKPLESPASDGSLCLTDGKVRLLIRPCNNHLYRGLREGLDHIGFHVENLDRAKQELAELARTDPTAAPRKIDLSKHGKLILKDLEGCPIGQHPTADPDGVLLDLSDR